MVNMSAITGIFYRNGSKVSYNQIKRMNDLLHHRGPDGSKIYFEDSVGFGHQMLKTTLESINEILPFEEDNLIITADARIDNRKELSEKLSIEDKVENSDSYFVLKSYQKWGENCPDKLLGDFTFVIWDKEKQIIFCARDHMGVKPFYYYLSDDVFFFSTEIKSILINQEVPRELNELKIAYHLIPLTTDRKSTFYKYVHILPAAHRFIISSEDYSVSNYWQLDCNLNFSADSEEEYYKRFREIFEESIRCRMRSNYKIGFELSGGLDSSSVICMAKKILNNENIKIESFSNVFKKFKEVDESYYINKVINSDGFNPHYINSDNISPLKDIENIFEFIRRATYFPQCIINLGII